MATLLFFDIFTLLIFLDVRVGRHWHSHCFCYFCFYIFPPSSLLYLQIGIRCVLNGRLSTKNSQFSEKYVCAARCKKGVLARNTRNRCSLVGRIVKLVLSYWTGWPCPVMYNQGSAIKIRSSVGEVRSACVKFPWPSNISLHIQKRVQCS